MSGKAQRALAYASLWFVAVMSAHAQLPPENSTTQPKPLTVRENPKDGLKYVRIPPGTFMMGCSPGDDDCANWEKPAHQVTITKGFWMGQTPVTAGAYKRFAASSGRQMPRAASFNSRWMNENMPIVNVNRNDAQAYCGWTGLRLPTEAEWENAARGGTTGARYVDYADLDDIAWHNQNSGGQAHDVAQKRPNRFGLYDMLGNVLEWVNDWYDQNYYQNSPSKDPTGPASGLQGILRGASWESNPGLVRVSNRIWMDPDSSIDSIGFRCGGEAADLFGSIRIHTTPGAAVLLDEVRKGTANPDGRVVIPEVTAGDHYLHITARDKKDYRQSVSIRAGREKKVDAVLADLPSLASTVATARENPKDGLKYVWIPPGTFMMGCSTGDNTCYDDAKPAHQVTISQGFWMGQTEVTVGAYKRFAASSGWQMHSAPDFNSGWTNENMPIVNVTWDDAQAYCFWAGGRLPTEAEWEYAARAGSAEARYGPLDEIAWYGENSGGRPHDVAQKRANAWGLFDTIGNVDEWVADWYDEHYYSRSPSADPPGASTGQSRVIRGLSWFSGGWGRVFDRGGADPDLRGGFAPGVGFRCGGAPVPTPKAAQILVQTSPGADVYLDDQHAGRAGPVEPWLVIANPPLGEHKLRVSLAGKKDYQQQITVAAGEATVARATLADLPASIRVHTSAGAEVFLDNTDRGSADARGELLLFDVPARPHQLRISARGKKDCEQQVTVTPGETTNVQAALADFEMPKQTEVTMRENSKDGLKYVWIPPGTFMMGCSPGDNYCRDDEKPAHQVTISKGFWMGETEVTVVAYKRFASQTRQAMPPTAWYNVGWKDDAQPIEGVPWNDAQGFCQWAGGRLPSEAEWEYAARGGSTEARYGPLDEVAWYGNNSGGKTHEVGQKQANGFGLFDMLGNVLEWVNDWYDQHYYSRSPSTDPPGATSAEDRVPRGSSVARPEQAATVVASQDRVLRGGSWGRLPWGVRVSTRYRLDPNWRVGAGFRCVKDVF